MGTRLVFLDLEGTLVAKQGLSLRDGDPGHHHSLWSRLMQELGEAAIGENAKTIQKWESGAYASYINWVDDSVRVLQRHRLSLQLFGEVLESIPLNPGVAATILELHRRGLKTAIVSGGFAEQAKRVQAELQIAHSQSAVELFWDEFGQIAHWNIFPSDYEGKRDYLHLLRREYGFAPHECAFVGDGQNDVAIAREVGISFAYDAHEALRDVATHSVSEFDRILDHLP
jgi:phosphoserine phosphatase